MGGLFEAVDPGVVAAGESVGEGFFESDLLFARGRALEEHAHNGPRRRDLPAAFPLWLGARRRACALRGTRGRRSG